MFSALRLCIESCCCFIFKLAALISVLYTSRSLEMSASRARMYCSFRSRCVLCTAASSVYTIQYHSDLVNPRRFNPVFCYLCACRLSSCRRVRAGFESGLGPRRLAGCPSPVTPYHVSVSFIHCPESDSFGTPPFVLLVPAPIAFKNPLSLFDSGGGASTQPMWLV